MRIARDWGGSAARDPQRKIQVGNSTWIIQLDSVDVLGARSAPYQGLSWTQGTQTNLWLRFTWSRRYHRRPGLFITKFLRKNVIIYLPKSLMYKNIFLKTKIEKNIRGFENALSVFQEAASSVPAYKDFLAKNSVDPKRIKTIDDWRLIPPVTKDNYLLKYPLRDLLLEGKWERAQFISMSSGSSGKPFFWPRGNGAIKDSSFLHEAIFNQGVDTRKKSTLAIVAFAMGTWIAGTYTISALQQLSDEGHKIVTISPGIMKEEIVKILKTIAFDFEQVILFGYPPFVKDVIDAAIDEKFDLKSLNIKLIFAGENISESWRDYLLRHIGAADELRTSFNIYGTADAGLLGAETPLSIYVRRQADKNEKLFSLIFPNAPMLPTLVRYVPELRYFEEADGNIILTARNSLPLVRYAIKDQGRILHQDSIIQLIKSMGIILPKGIVQGEDPMVALYGRPDVAATFYALNIYPENVKYGLEIHSLEKLVTGKFVIKTEYDEVTQDQTLHIYIELKKGVSPSPRYEKIIFKYVLKSLLENNSEYGKLHQELGATAEPKVHLTRYGSAEFDIGAKHSWISKA